MSEVLCCTFMMRKSREREKKKKKTTKVETRFFFFVNIGEFVFNIQNNRPNLLRVLTFFAPLLGLEDTDDLGYVMGQLVCLYSWRSFPGSRMASYFYGRFVVYGDLLFGGLVFTAATAVYCTDYYLQQGLLSFASGTTFCVRLPGCSDMLMQLRSFATAPPPVGC